MSDVIDSSGWGFGFPDRLLLVSLGVVISVLAVEGTMRLLGLGEFPRVALPIEASAEACAAESYDELREDQRQGGSLDLANEIRRANADVSENAEILILGDSFAAGVGAGPGEGFVYLLGDHYRRRGETIINSGVAGFGQNDQLAVLEEHFDNGKLGAVFMAFFLGNDFGDNIFPAGERYAAFHGQWANRYEMRHHGGVWQVRRRSKAETFHSWRMVVGCPVFSSYRPDAIAAAALFRTRIGGFLVRALADWDPPGAVARIRREGLEQKWLPRINQDFNASTEYYLSEIKEFLDRRGVPLYVVLIHPPGVFRSAERRVRAYSVARRLFAELSIPFLDTKHQVSFSDYVQNDDHWNSTGHRKVFEMIRQCFGDSLRNSPAPGCLGR